MANENASTDDDLLAEIDRVLEPNAADFVASYVQYAGNGGAQYFALAERIADAIGFDESRMLIRTLRRFTRTSRYGQQGLYDLLLQHAGRDMARFLMSGEHIEPLRLIDGLKQVVAGDLIDPEEDRDETQSADEQEKEAEARNLLANGDIERGVRLLRAHYQSTPNDRGRLHDEFAFIVDDELEASASLPARLTVWGAFAATNPGTDAQHELTVDTINVDLDLSEPHADDQSDNPTSRMSNEAAVNRRSSQASGEVLEVAFTDILRRLFELPEDTLDVLWKRLRRQRAGTQFGHDIQFDAMVAGSTVRCHVECKNYERPLTTSDVADKILQTEAYWQEKQLDHFIIVSPRSGIANDLDLLIQTLNARPDRSFHIQAWTPENRVDELFAIEPTAYEAVYRSEPRHVDEAKVVAEWRSKLRPWARQSRAITTYLKTPALHCLSGEDSAEFAELYERPIDVLSTRAGRPERVALVERLTTWLADTSSRTALVLGEFGDGKSFSSYRLTRDLAQKYEASPDKGMFALRLPLRDLRTAGSPQALLNERLAAIGADVADWTRINAVGKTVLVLDGLDEVSTRMDQSTVAENFKLVAQCVRYFSNSKILITSRTHYFEARRDQERFFEQLGDPTVLKLAAVARTKTQEHLAGYAREHDLVGKLHQIQRLYDPIGLASKPLFLQMIKATLAALPEDAFNEVILYETYVRESLKRKSELLQDEGIGTLQSEALDGMLTILERVAVEMALNEGRPVDLSGLNAQEDFAQTLWRMSLADKFSDAPDDARGRIAIRSLLVPAIVDSRNEATGQVGWSVAFFHRSMGQYFLARAIVELIVNQAAHAKALLAAAPLAKETVDFVRQLAAAEEGALTADLESLACSAVAGTDYGFLGGNALTLLIAIGGRPRRTNWAELMLDAADLRGCDLTGMVFEGSSLTNANFDNCDLTDVNFRNADLTGVRLEETAAVVQVSAGRGSGTLLACYSDGAVLEWNYESRNAHATILLSGLEGVVGASWIQSGDLLVNRTQHLEIYDVSGAQAKRLARLRKLIDIVDFHAGAERLFLLTMQPFGCTLTIWDYSSPLPVKDLRFQVEFSKLTPVTDDLIALRSRHGETVVVQMSNGKTVAATDRFDFGQALVGSASGVSSQFFVGDDNGTIRWCRLPAGEAVPEFVAQSHAHDGWISSVAELTDGLVASGGVDRTVAVIEPGANDYLIVRQTLRLSLRCEGVLTDGMQGPTERTALERLRDRGVVEPGPTLAS